MPQTAAQLLHALDAERAHYASLYDLTPMGYLTLGVDGVIRQANRACGTLFGEAPGGLVRRSIYDFVVRKDHATWMELCTRLLETDEPQTRELQLSATGGTAFWAQVTVTATHDADGQAALLVTLADVTVRKQDEAVMAARLRLMAMAPSATVAELLRATLDEAELLTGSTIGFYHFLEADQKTLWL
ncbi:MAG: PAS domain-containing protein, partial [Gemmatimonadetes bacterium]|nr:PAS domain-containing protein [Gemmatimonadota bacterium]